MFEAQPKYERIVQLGQRRWGLTVREANGEVSVHELAGRLRLDGTP